MVILSLKIVPSLQELDSLMLPLLRAILYHWLSVSHPAVVNNCLVQVLSNLILLELWEGFSQQGMQGEGRTVYLEEAICLSWSHHTVGILVKYFKINLTDFHLNLDLWMFYSRILFRELKLATSCYSLAGWSGDVWKINLEYQLLMI